MNEGILLSIIIPYYNIPLSQLEQCIRSMDFIRSITNYEVWIIDDGSKEDVVLEWAEGLNDAHIHVARQENMGPGGARNTGIEQARGEYITFVDADDYLLPEQYRLILRQLLEARPDILCHGAPSPWSGTAIRYMQAFDICPSCCSYIIHRDTLANLRFTPHIYHEDEEFCTKLHLSEARLLCVANNGYFYRFRPDSITHNKDPKALRKRYNDFVAVIRNLQKEVLLPSYRHALNRRIDIMAMCFVVTLMRDTDGRSMTEDCLSTLRGTGLYPLPSGWHGWRYFLVRISTHSLPLVLLITPMVKYIMEMRNKRNDTRSFVAHTNVQEK